MSEKQQVKKSLLHFFQIPSSAAHLKENFQILASGRDFSFLKLLLCPLFLWYEQTLNIFYYESFIPIYLRVYIPDDATIF